MIRLFVAIDIPEDIRSMMCGMGRSIPSARTVPSEQLHLTLKFLGDVENSMLQDIHQTLGTIETAPFTMCLKGVGHFPPRGRPQVLWAGIEPVSDVTRLRNRVEKALADISIPRDNRKFAAHVTLARLKNCSLQRITTFLADNSLFTSPLFTVRDFHLYSSTLSAKGAVHTLLATYTLAEPE